MLDLLTPTRKYQVGQLHRIKTARPCPQVNSCPGGFFCCVKLDSGYQVAKIADMF